MLILERFEGDTAVIENGESFIKISRDSLPDNAREGDVLVKNGGRYAVDEKQTALRREKILKLQNGLWS